MKLSIKNIVLLVLMLAAALTAWATRPHILLADQRAKINLEQLIPKQFGDWSELPQSNAQIINPQQTAILAKLYSQTLSRSYINSEGDVVMLSIAYGVNQSDGIALHYPEVCYPAQGFQLVSSQNVTLSTTFGALNAKQLMTSLGNRYEPVTYWTTLGDKVVRGGTQTKLTQLEYGFKGQIPDGLLFRLSSISRDAAQGYELQSQYARDLLTALPAEARLRLTGLGS